MYAIPSTDAMLTTAPPTGILGSSRSVRWRTPRKFTRMMSLLRVPGREPAMPWQLNSASARSSDSTARSIASGSPRSTSRKTMPSGASGGRRSSTVTSPPAARTSPAAARPMPEPPPPATTTCFPAYQSISRPREHGLLLGAERAQRLAVIGAGERQHLQRRRVVERRRQRLLDQLVDRELGVAHGQRRALREPLRERQRLVPPLLSRHRVGDEAEPLGVGGGQRVAGE